MALLGLATPAPAPAQEGPVTFSVIGDVPYTPFELEDLLEHVDAHNRLSPAGFLVHLGDILGSGQPCHELRYQEVADALRGLAVPAFIVPGDNEWNDCSDPDQAWAFWEGHLADFDSNFCSSLLVERQGVRRENFAFVSKGVLFVGINLVGGNPFDETEWERRLAQNVDWVGEQLDEQGPGVRAAVIFAHAGPGQATHAPFFDGFVPLATAFGKPVLYTMGDGHSFVIDKPFTEQNITRLQVERGIEAPVQVTVGLDPLAPFEIVRNPWPGGAPPFNREPCVDVGPAVSLDVDETLDLGALVTDDGVPDDDDPITIWSQSEGPARATLANALSLETTASFPIPGQYVLQLAAHDGELLGLDSLSVEVTSSTPVLAVDDVLVDEGQVAQFAVRLFSADGSQVSVDYATSDGSAQAPDDFTSVSGTLVFSGETTEAFVNVPVQADGLVEPNETFQLTLANPKGSILGRSEALARILDGDSIGPPWVDSFTPTIGTVGIEVMVEGAGLTGASEVLVGGAPAEGFTVDTDRELRAVVAGDALTGPVVVTTPAGTDQSLGSFASTLPVLEVGVNGSGTVALDPPGPIHPLGEIVTVTALPAPGFDFAGWSGDLAGLPNPADVTMDGDVSGAAQFDPLPPHTVSLDVAWQGPGSISFTPSGRLHPVGSLVTISATPDPGAVFLGWGGDLAGADSPTPLDMTVSRSVTGRFSRSGLPIVRENSEKGSSSGLDSVTTDEPVRDVAGDLYLAAVSGRRRADVVDVAGLGLEWVELVEQCTRQNESSVSLWWALGLPSVEEPVTATFSEPVANASIIVTRYSGVDAAQPFGAVPSLVSGNANGIDGACGGGIDSKDYALPLVATDFESVVYAAIASTSRHYPGDGWFEISEQRTGLGHRANLAVMEKGIPAPGEILVDGKLADEMDWAVAAVELQPQQIAPVEITSFSPAAGPSGTEVTLLGNALGGTTSVEFGGVPAQSVEVDTWAQIRAVVPPGATSGPVAVTTLLGSGVSAENFVVPECSDGVDNDGDGDVDFGRDLGCSDSEDASEQSASFPCDNGLDDDLDGLSDLDDPGCLLTASPREDPQCDDGLDNDGDGQIDWDGGPSGAAADASCEGHGWGTQEDVPSCGLGFELVLLLPLLRRWRRSQRRRSR